MTTEMKPKGNFRLIGLYKTNYFYDFIENISTFSYKKKDGEHESLALLKDVKMDENSLSVLKMLHPQARNFLIPKELDDRHPSVKLFCPNQNIENELKKTIWQAKAPKWSHDYLSDALIRDSEGEFAFQFSIQNITLSLFPTGIIIISMLIKPNIPLKNSNCQNIIQMMINSLHDTGTSKENEHAQAAILNRCFTNYKQQHSSVRRFADNNLTFFQGLSGLDSISIEDIFAVFLPQRYKNLLGDRFIGFSIIETQGTISDSFFSKEDFADLIRIARGENKRYIPKDSECQPESESITMTFDNVAFALSAEGIACWIKPIENQVFLKEQFIQRFNTIYFQLLQLALHQRYILIDMAERLNLATPSLVNMKNYHERVELDEINIYNDAKQLRSIRSEVANFYLRAYFKQPASLTNHQHFYSKLQSVFGVTDLFNEVHQATNELDYLISSIQERINHEQHTNLLSQMKALMHRQEQSAHIAYLLTIIVEAIGIPYYTFSFLVHAFQLEERFASSIGIVLAVFAIMFTIGSIYIFKRKNNKKRKRKK